MIPLLFGSRDPEGIIGVILIFITRSWTAETPSPPSFPFSSDCFSSPKVFSHQSGTSLFSSPSQLCLFHPSSIQSPVAAFLLHHNSPHFPFQSVAGDREDQPEGLWIVGEQRMPIRTLTGVRRCERKTATRGDSTGNSILFTTCNNHF